MNKKLCSLFLAWSCLVSSAAFCADDPAPQIPVPVISPAPIAKFSCPEKAYLGCAIVLDAKGSSGDVFVWRYSPMRDGDSFKRGRDEEDGSRYAVFTPGPKQSGAHITFVLVTANKNSETLPVDVSVHGVDVSGTAPPPGPTPNPPGPTPNPPDPTPTPVTSKLAIYVVYESADSTPNWGQIITSAGIREYCRVSGHSIYFIDKDTINQPWKSWCDKASGSPLPWLFITAQGTSNVLNGGGKGEAAPNTVDTFLRTLRLYGGGTAQPRAMQQPSSCPGGVCPPSG
jgi:hypothetical protein